MGLNVRLRDAARWYDWLWVAVFCIFNYDGWLLRVYLSRRGVRQGSVLPRGLAVKTSHVTVAARVQIPLQEHRPNHLDRR